MNKDEHLIWESYKLHVIQESYKQYIQKYGDTQFNKDVVSLHKKLKEKIPEQEKKDIMFWMNQEPALLWQYLNNLPKTKRQFKKTR